MSTTRARRVVQRELRPDETLVWQGRPGRTRMLAFTRISAVVFIAIWTGAAMIWSGFALDQGWFIEPITDDFIDRWMWLAGLPFFVAGFGGLYWQARGLWLTFAMTYGFTNQRIFIIEGWETHTFGAPELQHIRRTGTERRGTLAFAYGRIGTGAKPGDVLLNIEEPARIEALIRSTLLSPA